MSFRICTIGCGYMATAGHGPAYTRYRQENPDTILAGCCDVDPAKAEDFARRFGFGGSYTDVDAMLKAQRPDAVCLIVPVDKTCDLACKILKRGIPLLTEKPPGRNLEELDRMIAEAAGADTPNMVAFNRRFSPLLVELRRLMRPVEAAPFIQYDFVRINRKDADFTTTAIHGIDAVRFLVGSDYKNVSFEYQPIPGYGPTVVSLFMQATFVSGAIAHLNFCPVAGLVAERATVQVPDNAFFLYGSCWGGFDYPGKIQHVREGKVIFQTTGPDLCGSTETFVTDGFFAENAVFFNDIRAGRSPQVNLQSSRQSLEVAQAMFERRKHYTARA